MCGMKINTVKTKSCKILPKLRFSAVIPDLFYSLKQIISLPSDSPNFVALLFEILIDVAFKHTVVYLAAFVGKGAEKRLEPFV